jgi:hypothetical protein
MSFDLGRGYEGSSVFTADPRSIEQLQGKNVYLGEICGKHSEIVERVGEEIQIDLVTTNSEAISAVEVFLIGRAKAERPDANDEQIMGNVRYTDWLGNYYFVLSGTCPLSYYEGDDEDEDESED